MKVLFRADSSAGIGTGDIKTFLYLEKVLQNSGFETHFCSLKNPTSVELLNSFAQSRVHWLHSIQEQEQVFKQLQPDWILWQITDGSFLRMEIPSYCRNIAVNFDGLIPSGLDLVVNWSPDSHTLYEQATGKTEFMLGPQFTFMNPDLKKKESHRNLEKVLVNFGGNDEHDLSSQVLYEMYKSKPDFKVIVLLGPGYKGTLKTNQGTEAEIIKNLSDVSHLLLDIDFAITACGMMLSELAYCNIPNLSIATQEHQVTRAREYHELGWTHYLGQFPGRQTVELNTIKNVFESYSPKREFKSEGILKVLQFMTEECRKN